MHRRSPLIGLLALALGSLACALAAQPPTATPAAGWPTYTNAAHGFSISHPPEMTTPPADHADSFGAIGDQVFFNIGPTDPVGCQGDCPVIETNTSVTVAGQPATKLTGFIGSIGGNVPQQYQTYVFTRAGRYYSFTLYAVPSGTTSDDLTTVPLEPADIAVFEQMIETVQFTN